MELQKLRKQIKPEIIKIPKSYPSPAEKEQKAKKEGCKDDIIKNNTVMAKKSLASNEEAEEIDKSGVVVLNVLPSLTHFATDKVSLDEGVLSHVTMQELELPSAYYILDDRLENPRKEFYQVTKKP